MARSMEDAAKTLVHYIEVMARRTGDGLGWDERRELDDAVEAFREADRLLDSQRPQ
jgi:hypothetical protein